MPHQLVTAPATEPVTLAEAKAHLRVDHDTEDTLITALITAARRQTEEFTRRALITQTWDMWLDAAPVAGALHLSRPPLLSVTAVYYFQDDNEQQAWDVSNYLVDVPGGRLVLATGGMWPSGLRPANGIQVRFQAGYGAAGDVPADIKQAVLITIADLYENRESAVTGTIISPVPLGARVLLQPYRLLRLY